MKKEHVGRFNNPLNYIIKYITVNMDAENNNKKHHIIIDIENIENDNEKKWN